MKNEPPGKKSVARIVFRGSLVNISASIITLILGFGRSILLARLLLPEDYGVVALAAFYIGLLTRLRGWGLDSAFIHHQKTDEDFVRTFFTLRLGIDILTFGAILVTVPVLCIFYPDLPQFGAVISVLGVVFLLGTLSQLQETFLLKSLAYSKLAITNVTASLVMTVVAPYLAWTGWECGHW
jgi:PST family polysaccharide transporter